MDQVRLSYYKVMLLLMFFFFCFALTASFTVQVVLKILEDIYILSSGGY